jgi:hypothetical protein
MVSGVCQILLSSVLDGPRSLVRDRGLVSETLALMLGGLGLSVEAAERRAREAAEDLIR